MRTNTFVCELNINMEQNKEQERPLGAIIRHTSNAVKVYIDNYLNEHLSIRLTGIEGMTMGFIFRHKGERITARNIMNAHHVSKATVSQTLNGLEKKGLIKTVNDEDDLRMKFIVLTPKGEQAHKDFDEMFKVINAKIEEGLSQEEKEGCTKVLFRILDNVGSKEDIEEGRGKKK